ncbi:transcription initiation factor IID, TAF10 subunit [Aspergillus campestris IBT 28561]|uniref:Transcription initiation factor TFIID subunit 10 n=1 Tax=Aspergillus campestris (strain IBT 28561) TaxID=1392248 RepID=A0A2I1D1A7_ASPC2|nr:transcription initiation factor IID, TAF10 subunit [Aspergillus campestris IBT 28561]PKY03655.1 transcription initiation factor IID, TAF10 subunit [Aspergillus campestris IBT 28561]
MSNQSSSQLPSIPPSSQPPPASQDPQPPSSSSAPTGEPTAAPPASSSETPVVPKQEEPDTQDSSIDPTIEQDIDMDPAKKMANNENGDDAGPLNPAQEAASADALAAAAAPSKKETSLREFLGKMDEYAPIIPDAVTAHYLTLAGLPPPGNGPNQTPPHLARLLALATQKFVADIAADSYQYARIRASNSSSASNPMGSLNAASGLGMPAGAAGAAAGAAAGPSGADAKGKAGAHLGIQRPGFGGGGSGGSGQGRTVLTMEDLGMAVSEYGVSVKRGEFYR